MPVAAVVNLREQLDGMLQQIRHERHFSYRLANRAKKIEKEWTKYRVRNGLDLYGNPSKFSAGF